MDWGDWVYNKAAINVGNGSSQEAQQGGGGDQPVVVLGGAAGSGSRQQRRRRRRHLLTRGGGRVQQDEKENDNLVRDVPASGNGVDHSEEFAPVEHPLEPRDIDKPARCPAPEPSIVHDGRIWKERVAVARRRLDMVNDKDGTSSRSRRRSFSSEDLIFLSRSAPANFTSH